MWKLTIYRSGLCKQFALDVYQGPRCSTADGVVTSTPIIQLCRELCPPVCPSVCQSVQLWNDPTAPHAVSLPRLLESGSANCRCHSPRSGTGSVLVSDGCADTIDLNHHRVVYTHLYRRLLAPCALGTVFGSLG